MNNLLYDFTPFPNNLLDQILLICKNPKSRLTQNELIVLLFISRQILGYKKQREALKKKMSCRYIADGTGISFTNIPKILQSLSNRGFIRIEKFEKQKMSGSIIELILYSWQIVKSVS